MVAILNQRQFNEESNQIFFKQNHLNQGWLNLSPTLQKVKLKYYPQMMMTDPHVQQMPKKYFKNIRPKLNVSQSCHLINHKLEILKISNIVFPLLNSHTFCNEKVYSYKCKRVGLSWAEITNVCLTLPDQTEFHRTKKISSFSCSGCFQPIQGLPIFHFLF